MLYVVISPDLPSAGNHSIQSRVEGHFKNAGIPDYIVLEPSHFTKRPHCLLHAMNRFTRTNGVSGVLFIHAYESGKLLHCSCRLNCRAKFLYGVVVIGTDLNVDAQDPQKRDIIANCLEYSTFNIYYTSLLKRKGDAMISKDSPLREDLVCPPAVHHNLYKYVDVPLRDRPVGKPVIFLLQGSVRPSKNTTMLLKCFSELRSQLINDVRLLILGSVADREYYHTLLDEISAVLKSDQAQEYYYKTKGHPHKFDTDCSEQKAKSEDLPFPSIPNYDRTSPEVITKWIRDFKASFIQYLPAIEPKQLFSHLSDNTFIACINCSESEGMSSVLIEAMALGTPVLARNVPGNRVLIEHSKNGILFDSSRQFVKHALTLIKNEPLRQTLIGKAKFTIKRYHDPSVEGRVYLDLLEEKFPELRR